MTPTSVRRQAPALRPLTRLLATACLLTLAASAQAAGKAVSWEDIARDDKSPGDVLTYGLGLKAQRFSPSTKINTRNAADLVPAWTFSFGGEKQRGQEAQALVHDGVVYVTGSYSRVYALDAKTGKQLWAYEHRLPDDIRPCCDVVNRGAAIYGNKIYFGTLDARIVALDKDTGKVAWNAKFADHKVGHTMTAAPFIIKDKNGRVLLIHGDSGDEFGVVGWLYARDPETGEEVWARPMVEGHMGRLGGKDSSTGPAMAGPRRLKACTDSWPPGAGSAHSRSGAGEAWCRAAGGRSAHSGQPLSCAARCSRRHTAAGASAHHSTAAQLRERSACSAAQAASVSWSGVRQIRPASEMPHCCRAGA